MKTKQLREDILAPSLRKQSEKSSNYGKVRTICIAEKTKKIRTSHIIISHMFFLF